MKSCKFLFAIAFALIFGCQLVNAQSKGVVYIFGLSDSTRDSIVYVTDVQRIDMANIQKQTKFLLDRADYAQQLKDYFANRLNDNKRINVVYVCKNEKAAKKKGKMEEGVYYNVPERVAVSVFNASREFCKGEFPMGQFGHVEILSNVLFDKKTTDEPTGTCYQDTFLHGSE